MSDSLNDWAAGCKAAMLTDVKNRVKRTAEVLVRNTPIGHKNPTGRHKNSWKAAIGSKPTGTDPGPGTHDISGQAALLQIEGVIDSLQPGQKLFVASDMPGIKEIEEGSKHSRPARMLLGSANQWSD